MNILNPGYYITSELKKLNFNKLGENVFISKACNIIGPENISIGSNVRIDNFSNLICKDGKIVIGNYCHISTNCFILGSGEVEMGDFSGLAPGVKVFSSSDNYDGSTLTNPMVGLEFSKPLKKKIIIEKYVIIGANSVVLPGIKIGEGASVGALSLVSKNLDEWMIYFGAPIKKLKSRKKEIILDMEKKFLEKQKMKEEK